MKFLCPNCKAKYRIGPEKMVGRQAAKIRCRKCEYLIQIAYRGTSDEFDVTATPPSNPPPPGPVPAPVPAPRLPKAAAGQPVIPANPVQRQRATGGFAAASKDEGSANKKPTAAVPGLPGLGSAKSTRGAALLSDAAAMPRRPLAPLPPPPVPPIPGAGLGAALPQPTAGPLPSGSGAMMSALAMQPQPSAPASVAPQPPPVSPPPPRPPNNNSTQLGDQFRESVQAGGAPDDLPQEGWFVGVNGVPLGPIPLGDLRELAMAGHIDRRSLVWRDGQGEWRPLGKFPGLARVIDDGQGPASTPRPEPAPQAAPAPRSNGAATNGHVATGFDVVRPDSGERPSAWGDLDDEDDADEQPTTVKGRVSVFPNTGAFPASALAASAPAPTPSAPAPPVAPVGLPPMASNPFGVTSSVVAVPPPAQAPYSAPPVASESGGPASAISNTPEPIVDADVHGLRPSSRNRWYLIVVAIVFAFALGAIITHLMGSPSEPEKPGKSGSSTSRSEPARAEAEKPEKPEKSTVQVADEDPPEDDRPTPPAAAAVERAPPPVAPSTRSILGATLAPVASPPAALPSAPSPSPKPAASGGSLLAGLGGLPAAGGPAQPRAEDHALGTGLDATAIQRTVRRYSPGVRQNCWQRALNARAPGSPSSAKVSATITVDSTGRVEGVTVAGAPKGYPGLARCIESAVKGWQFPRSGGQTVTNVPFMFVGQ